MKKTVFNKRIPTLFALLVLVVIIGISTILIQSGIFYVGKAAPDTQPLHFMISNISDTSFTAIFTTTGLANATLVLNNATTGNTVIFDDRDKKNGQQNNYYSHHITVQNLTPATRYTFQLLVGGKEYKDPTYTAQTAPTITSQPPLQKPLYGKVLMPDGTMGIDTIVTAKSDSSQLITTVTDSKGEFILPTNAARNTQGTEYITLDNFSSLTLLFFRQSLTAQANTNFKIAQNLPAVTLSQEYTFIEKEDELPIQASQFTVNSSDQSNQTVTVRVPKEGEYFIDDRPQFSGTSYPNSSVTISIRGGIRQQVLTRADGLWIYQPQNPLPPGTHSLSIISTNQTDEPTSINRTFTIFSQGSQVAQSATPSAQPTRTPSPTLAITPTTIPATPTPTASLPISTPTTAATPTPSPTLLPTINYTPTNTPTISAPGGIENTALLTGFSILLIVAGLTLLLIL